MPVLDTSPRSIVPCSGYGWTSFGTSDDLNLIAAYTEVCNIHRRSRVRQNGTVKKVEFRVGTTLANITDVRVRFWRWNGATYNLVGQTDNIRSVLTALSTNLVTLTNSVSGIQEGDYVSLAFQGTLPNNQAFAMTNSGAGLAHLRYVQADPGTAINWDVQSTLADKYVQIRCYMDSPAVVFIGDSHIAGANSHRSYIEDRPVSEIHSFDSIATTLPYQTMLLATGFLSHVTYQNMGVGGEEITTTSARYPADATNLLPHIVISMSGWNDVRNGETSVPNFQADLQTQIDSATTGLHRLGYIQGAPLTGESNAEHQTFDLWMAAAQAMLVEPNLYIDQRHLTGNFRVGGDPGNLWDWLPGFADPVDLIHPTAAANVKVAEAVWEALEAVLFPPYIAPPTLRYTDVDKFLRDVWPVQPNEAMPRVVLAAARIAYAYINSKLRDRYTVPFTAPVPDEIVAISDLLTKCIAISLQTKGAPILPKTVKKRDDVHDSCSLAVMWLDDLAAGRAGLDVPAVAGSSGFHTRDGYTPIFDVDSGINHGPDRDLVNAILRGRN